MKRAGMKRGGMAGARWMSRAVNGDRKRCAGGGWGNARGEGPIKYAGGGGRKHREGMRAERESLKLQCIRLGSSVVAVQLLFEEEAAAWIGC